MSVITFWNQEDQETGKTMSLIAIATYMAIEHNVRTLILSTTNKKDRINTAFFEQEKKKKFSLGIFGPNTNMIDTESGIKGLEKVIRSNKITPNIITNYTKVVFKDRLEILFGNEENAETSSATKKENQRLMGFYPEVINAANQYYDRILIDLDYNVPEEIREKILNISDVIVLNIKQGLSDLQKMKETKEQNKIWNLPKTLLMIGKYDRFSKYNAKNISRFLGEKNQVLTIPYNTQFFEGTEEAGVPDLFLRLSKFRDQDDYNMYFLENVKNATENIIYRLQEIQANLR